MIKIHEIDYEDLGGVASGKDSFRVVRHLELIFPLMSLQALSFSSGVLTGNLLNTSIFREFNLLLSRCFFSWLPSVLLSASSFLVKKCRSKFRAHKCLWVSGLANVSCIALNLDGVTQVLINSSPTSWEIGADGSSADGSTADGSSAEGSTAEGSTAVGSSADGSPAEGCSAVRSSSRSTSRVS